MNKRIDFSFTGGFPFSQNTFDFMQSSYKDAIGALATAYGDNVIVTGIDDLGTSYSDGWVIISGVLMPFIGGAKQDKITTEEISDTETFNDDNVRTVYYTKRAKLASLTGTAITSFKRMKSVSELETIIADLQAHKVPTGLISMWSGAIVDIPTGWALCDGTGGTPNLKGRFIVGYASDYAPYDTIGNTGGAESVILTEAQMPRHRHTYVAPINNGSHPGGSGGYDRPNAAESGNTGYTGNDEAHENRPPYYTLAYIIKL